MALNPNRDSEMERLCVRLYRSDVSKLRHMSEVKGVGFNLLMRQIIRASVAQITALERKNLDQEELTTHRMELNGIDEIAGDIAEESSEFV